MCDSESGMQSPRATEQALLRDRDRHSRLWGDDYDEEPPEDEQGTKDVDLKGSTRRLMNARRMLRYAGSRGIKAEYMKAQVSPRMDVPDKEEREFITAILTSVPMMNQSTEMMQWCEKTYLDIASNYCSAGGSAESDTPAIAKTRQEVCDAWQSQCLSMAASFMHRAKIGVAEICWQEMVRPARGEAAEWSEKFHSLKSKFHNARTDYLKEVTALRDHVRIRGDPEGCLEGKSLDVMTFFDPTQTLEPAELQFTLKVLQEKLKMIFEANPTVSNAVDFGQIERLKEIVSCHEIKTLQKKLGQKVNELRQLKKANGISEKQAASQLNEIQQAESETEKAIQAMEAELADLQMKYSEAERNLQKQQTLIDALKDDTERAQQDLERSQSEYQVLQHDFEKSKGEYTVVRRKSIELHENLEAANLVIEELQQAASGQQTKRRRSSVPVSNASDQEDVLGYLGKEEDLTTTEAPGERVLKFDRQSSGQSTEDSSEEEELVRLTRQLHEQIKLNLQETNADPEVSPMFMLSNIVSEEASNLVVRTRELELECLRLQEDLESQAHGLVLTQAEATLDQANMLNDVMRRFQDEHTKEPIESASTVYESLGSHMTASTADMTGCSDATASDLESTVQALRSGMGEEMRKLQSEMGSGADQNIMDAEERLFNIHKQHLAAEMALALKQAEDARRVAKNQAFEASESVAAQECSKCHETSEALAQAQRMIGVLTAKLQKAAAENIELQEMIFSMNANMRQTTLALESVPEFKDNPHLQQCIRRMKEVAVANLPDVFSRLWQDAERRLMGAPRRRRIAPRAANPKTSVASREPAPEPSTSAEEGAGECEVAKPVPEQAMLLSIQAASPLSPPGPQAPPRATKHKQIKARSRTDRICSKSSRSPSPVPHVGMTARHSRTQDIASTAGMEPTLPMQLAQTEGAVSLEDARNRLNAIHQPNASTFPSAPRRPSRVKACRRPSAPDASQPLDAQGQPALMAQGIQPAELRRSSSGSVGPSQPPASARDASKHRALPRRHSDTRSLGLEVDTSGNRHAVLPDLPASARASASRISATMHVAPGGGSILSSRRCEQIDSLG